MIRIKYNRKKEGVSEMAERDYDVVVIGGGSAGYTAALYCARAGLKTLVVEKTATGGQMSTADWVDNYPGFAEGVEGFGLALEMKKQAERFGAESLFAEVTAAALEGPLKQIQAGGKTYTARAVVAATGAAPRLLGVPGERELVGKGVCYCATCDGPLYRGKIVAVVGGGDSAVTESVFLAKFCRKVILIHRRGELGGVPSYRKALRSLKNVEILLDSAVGELLSDGKLTGLRVRGLKTGRTREIGCEGVFVAIGRQPSTELFRGSLELSPGGYLKADESTETRIPGVFAAGDVREKPFRQIVTAVADGAVAAHMAEEYLSREEAV